MGYCMTQEESEFFIAANDIASAMQAMRELSIQTDKMSGASYQGGKVVSRHFSWVDMDYAQKTSFPKMLECWGWEPYVDDEGNIASIEFQRTKLGDEVHLFKALAPFVKEGSFIQMRGEDGSLWRWTFDGKKMLEKFGTVVWE
jgi:hypothetical protein